MPITLKHTHTHTQRGISNYVAYKLIEIWPFKLKLTHANCELPKKGGHKIGQRQLKICHNPREIMSEKAA